MKYIYVLRFLFQLTRDGSIRGVSSSGATCHTLLSYVKLLMGGSLFQEYTYSSIYIACNAQKSHVLHAVNFTDPFIVCLELHI